MGKNILADHNLSEIRLSRDPQRFVKWDEPGFFKSIGEVSVCWRQPMSYTGNYRMEVTFAESDIVQLFKAMFGRELSADLLERHGFTIAADLKKKILSEIKLADLTIGDLAGIATPSAKAVEPEQASAAVKPLRRHII